MQSPNISTIHVNSMGDDKHHPCHVYGMWKKQSRKISTIHVMSMGDKISTIHVMSMGDKISTIHVMGVDRITLVVTISTLGRTKPTPTSPWYNLVIISSHS